MKSVFLGLIPLSVLIGCNQGPQVKKLKVGEKVTIMPSQKLSLASTPDQYKNIFFNFNVGGKSLEYKDNTTIEIYYKGNPETPQFSYKARQLKHMHKDTNCPSKYEKVLNNAYEGDAIFCNNTLELDRIDFFKAVREGKSTKTATSYSLEGVIEGYDLIKVGVGFH